MRENWDPGALSDRFLARATERERYAKQCRSKISRSASYKRLHDEALAEFYVAFRLPGRTFLASREELVAELKAMLKLKFNATDTFEPERFDKMYAAEVNRLLKEFDVA